MIKIENVEVVGWEHAIRGMRNAMNSWDKIDSFRTCNHSGFPCKECIDYPDCKRTPDYYRLGPNDHELMMKLRNAGTDHRKFMRMIVVYLDITAPLYWWKEFDTYKVGTVANSCSTMHKIHAKEFTLEDFSTEHLDETDKDLRLILRGTDAVAPRDILLQNIRSMNWYRELFLKNKDKKYWWQMIQLLPTSYNQKRTIMLNYEVLSNIYKSRKAHKLDEWREFCKWIEQLPYSELIVGEDHEQTT